MQKLFIVGLVLAAIGSARAAHPPLWTGSFDDDWQKRWHVSKRKWGMDNLQVVTDEKGPFRKFLRVSYPARSASPTVARLEKVPRGGGQFYATLGTEPRDRLHLRYYVRFADSFDFVKGGKLPGLYGGSAGTGGDIPDGENGFTTRFMWRKKGAGEVYAYTPASVEHGTSLGRGRWRFSTGRWHLIEQEVVLNTPGKADGRIGVWFDEKKVFEQNRLIFRTTDALKIEGILFSTFFGGDDATWATPIKTHADFAGFAVGEKYLGPITNE